MRHSGKSSKSMSPVNSSGIKKENMGLHLTGRDLLPVTESRKHPVIWFLTSVVQLFLLVGGLAGAWTTGYELVVSPWILTIGMLFFTVVLSLFFYAERLNGYRIYGILAGALLYFVLLFFTQDLFIAGAKQMGNAILRSMNKRYESNLQLFAAGGGEDALTVFWMEVCIFIIFLLAISVVYRADVLMTMLLLFPVISFLSLTGSEPSALSLFAILFGVLSLMASARLVRKKRLWGEKESERFTKNLNWHRNIQRKTAAFVCLLGFLLSIPAFYLLRPTLDVQFSKAESVTAKAEGRLMEMMLDILPKISAGRLNLRVETAGGGVADGALGDVEGYALENVEDLKLTSSYKPQETIYLKGYVGSGYTGDHWLELDGELFEDAAANWKIEGDPTLYIQNLPFLRKLYTEEETQEAAMQELKVERLNANSRYTYYPYYSYLNDYYEVQGGDSYVLGQSVQDDLFSYYPRAQYQQAMEVWNNDEDKISILDQIEASYHAYVKITCLEIPEGFEQLQEQCMQQDIDEGDVDEAQAYIYRFLEGYTYSMDVPRLPEGEDFVKYFLYETKAGFSTHYASTAVLMFRMFGIPARYVTGYAAPQNLFKAQTDGTYTAILQGDNAHSWVEVYVDRVGWKPVEMTPGALGTAEEVEYVGEAAPNTGTPQEEQEEETVSEEETIETESKLKTLITELLGKDDLETVIGWFAIVAVLTAFVYTIGKSILRRRRDLGLGRKRSPEERIGDVFCAFYRKMEKNGMPPTVESTQEAFRVWVKRANPLIRDDEYDRMIDLVLESRFGYRHQTEREVLFMRRMYRRLKRISKKQMLKK